MQLWRKGYSVNKQIEDFTVGEDHILDQSLIKYDCLASIAHVKMLNKINILTKTEAKKLINELNNIIEISNKNKFEILKEQEDCHTAIENHLTEKLGDLGKKIHTARSRNDQVLTALRLYYKSELNFIVVLAEEFNTSILTLIEKYGEIQLPGYTHTRKAMPSSIKLWGGSFIDSMKDNLKLIDIAFELIDQCPLGTGAGYGIPLEIDRKTTARNLSFASQQENPLYTQNSRGKFESTILHAISQIMFDLNKIASDLITFSMPEFGYFKLPREFCTGSSIMPQKLNPDVFELLRAKYHVIISYEIQLKNITANLISGYNRDIQLTKEPVMKSFKIVKESLSIATVIFNNLKVNKQNCKKALTDELFATSEIYKLVKAGTPFREAYQQIAQKF